MSETIDFSAFSGDRVADNFFIPKDHCMERVAMRHVFNAMAREMGLSQASLRTRSEDVTNTAIEHIAFGYDLCETYAESFFPKGYKPNLDALRLVVICGGYVNEINEPLDNSEEGQPAKMRRDGINETTVLQACVIWEEAVELVASGKLEDGVSSYEADLLAHIHCFENLKNLDEDLEFHDIEQLNKILDEGFPPARNIANMGTPIGKRLRSDLDDMEQRVKAEIIRKTPKQHRLSLVSHNSSL